MTYSRTIRMTVAASLSLLLAGGCQTTGSEGATSFTDSISSTFRAINPWDTTPEIDERVIDRLLAGSLALEKSRLASSTMGSRETMSACD